MNTSIDLKQVNGQLRVPASKSMMQRVCAAALLHKGTTSVFHYGSSDDEKAALNIIQQLGAVVTIAGDHLDITGSGMPFPTGTTIHCGESGLAARLFTPIAALCSTPVTISGSGSLPERPMNTLLEILPALGVKLDSINGKLPVTVQGPLVPQNSTVDGSLSSQFISGLLFAYTNTVREKTTITVSHAVSGAYLDLSLEVLALFGKPVLRTAGERFIIDPALFELQDTVKVSVEGDWSSAAFWVVAAAISGSITLSGLKENSTQPDKAVAAIVAQCGAAVLWEQGMLQVSSRPLTAFRYNATDSPDLFPVLAVLAACCNGESCISGLHRLQHKESNREQSILQLLDALGVPARTKDNSLYVTGVPVFKPAVISSFNDHRIVMAAALAALRCQGAVTILQSESVRKSYPGFFADIERYGGHCS